MPETETPELTTVVDGEQTEPQGYNPPTVLVWKRWSENVANFALFNGASIGEMTTAGGILGRWGEIMADGLNGAHPVLRGPHVPGEGMEFNEGFRIETQDQAIMFQFKPDGDYDLTLCVGQVPGIILMFDAAHLLMKRADYERNKFFIQRDQEFREQMEAEQRKQELLRGVRGNGVPPIGRST